jgi:glutaconyl-CoA/methylmalonyl-CoA decarboxylase subunit delta
MSYQEIAADSLQAVKDSLLRAGSESLSQITFDLSKPFASENIMLPVIGYVVVFISLLFLFIVFSSITKLLQTNIRKTLLRRGEKKEAEQPDLSISGEINAAIGMALFLHFNESHDFENTVLTIKKVQKNYSPWSSKIYGLREYPGN